MRETYAAGQYLLILQVSRYCLFALQQYLFTLEVKHITVFWLCSRICLLYKYFSVYNPLLFTPWKAWCRLYNECRLYIVVVRNCKRTFFYIFKSLLPYIASNINALFFLYFTKGSRHWGTWELAGGG